MIASKKPTFKVAKTHYPTSYRNNERQILDSEALSIQLFEEIKKYIPAEISIEGISKEEHGTWQLDSLNPRIRICRYLPNQYFNKHLDGIHYASEIKQSKLTFMIYLNGNEEFEGGRTLFFNSMKDDTVISSYTPEKGDLIIFDHNLWHSGEQVITGEKYILRSDIMYTKIAGKESAKDSYCSEGHLGYIWTATLLGDHLITSGRDKKIKIWSKEGKKIDEVTGHKNSILSLIAFDNDTIISASRDMSTKIWKRNQDGRFQEENSIRLHKGAVLSLCNINENEFLSGGADGMIHLMNIDGSLMASHQAHNEWIWDIAKINDAHYATISEDGSLVIWNINNNQQIEKWEGDSPINSIVVENENIIFIGRLDGSIYKFQLDIEKKQLKQLNQKRCHEGIIRCLEIEGDKLYSGSEDNTVKIWRKDNFEFIELFKHNNFVQDIALLEGSMISVSYDGEIRKNRKPL